VVALTRRSMATSRPSHEVARSCQPLLPVECGPLAVVKTLAAAYHDELTRHSEQQTALPAILEAPHGKNSAASPASSQRRVETSIAFAKALREAPRAYLQCATPTTKAIMAQSLRFCPHPLSLCSESIASTVTTAPADAAVAASAAAVVLWRYWRAISTRLGCCCCCCCCWTRAGLKATAASTRQAVAYGCLSSSSAKVSTLPLAPTVLPPLLLAPLVQPPPQQARRRSMIHRHHRCCNAGGNAP